MRAFRLKSLQRNSVYLASLLLSLSICICSFSPPASANEAHAGLFSVSESDSILRRFLKAQRDELRELEKQHRLELQNLKKSQEAYQKGWELNERQARHKFFADNQKGPDRRTFVHDFINRRHQLHQKLKDEKTQLVQRHETQFKAMSEAHSKNLEEFRKALDLKQTPSLTLWPRPTGSPSPRPTP